MFFIAFRYVFRSFTRIRQLSEQEKVKPRSISPNADCLDAT